MKNKKLLNRVFVTALALTISLTLCGNVAEASAGLEVFADNTETLANEPVPKVEVDYIRYDAVREQAAEAFGYSLPSVEDVYAQYGTMNGDYYLIAMEERALALEGVTMVTPMKLQNIVNALTENGEIPFNMRKDLREAVAKYGMHESWLPDDPNFTTSAETARPTESPKFTSGNGSVVTGDDKLLEMIRAEHENADKQIPEPTATTTPVLNTGFPDVSPDAWYADAVAAMVEAGLLKGKGDGLFHPDDIITVAEWCTLLHRVTYKNASKYEGGIITGNVHYDHWAAYQIEMAYEHGLTRMRLGTDVYPEGGDVYDAIAQRGEAITGVVRILERMEYGDMNGNSVTSARIVMGDGSWTWDDIPDAEEVRKGAEPRDIRTTTAGDTIRDVASTHFWNPQDILNAYNLGIINGVDANGTCNPTGSMTRAQACKMLYEADLARCVGLWGGASGGIF